MRKTKLIFVFYLSLIDQTWIKHKTYLFKAHLLFFHDCTSNCFTIITSTSRGHYVPWFSRFKVGLLTSHSCRAVFESEREGERERVYSIREALSTPPCLPFQSALFSQRQLRLFGSEELQLEGGSPFYPSTPSPTHHLKKGDTQQLWPLWHLQHLQHACSWEIFSCCALVFALVFYGRVLFRQL